MLVVKGREQQARYGWDRGLLMPKGVQYVIAVDKSEIARVVCRCGIKEAVEKVEQNRNRNRNRIRIRIRIRKIEKWK